MKTLFKIFIILLMVTLISGFYYEAVTAMSPNAGQVDAPASGEFKPRERQGDHDGGSSFPVDSIKNLLIISAVSVGYLSVSKWITGKDRVTVPSK